MKRSTSEASTVTTLHPVHIRAKFYVLKPIAAMDLMCVVLYKVEGSRVTCIAHRV